jgi:hypothetical protein
VIGLSDLPHTHAAIRRRIFKSILSQKTQLVGPFKAMAQFKRELQSLIPSANSSILRHNRIPDLNENLSERDSPESQRDGTNQFY